jgi:hypothetical protein
MSPERATLAVIWRAGVQRVEVLAVGQFLHALEQARFQFFPVRPDIAAALRQDGEGGGEPAFEDAALALDGLLQGRVHGESGGWGRRLLV